MSSTAVIGAAVTVFIVAALLFYQHHAATDGFMNYPSHTWTSWSPSEPPVAGRLYDPAKPTHDTFPVPADLSKAPVAQVQGSIPHSNQRPHMTPGTGTSTAPREAMAQTKDLHELDSKIMLWLDAASQKEREQPGSLTGEQLQRRVMLQGRLRDVRDQMGTGMITDTWRRVADDLKQLRLENAGWQARSPSLDALYDFGVGKPPNVLLTHEEYMAFYGLFNAAVQELQGLTQADPLQRVRLQQLQVMRQDLMENARKLGTPPIRMAAAQLYLRQMLKVDQPLPTLYSLEPPPAASHEDSPHDVVADLRSMCSDPGAQHAAKAMLNKLRGGEMSPREARGHVATMKAQSAPLAYDPKDLMKRAQVLCEQVGEAFPEDAKALGCERRAQNEYEAETTINTVCERIRYSVPSVTPEQFNCPRRTV